MLFRSDIKLVRSHPEVVREALERRGAGSSSLDEFLAVEEERRRLTTAVEERRATRNAASDEIAKVKKSGGDAAQAIAAMKALGAEIKTLEEQLATTEGRMHELLLEIPNLVLDGVPPGGEDDAVVLREVGTPPTFDFEPKDHLELGDRKSVV